MTAAARMHSASTHSATSKVLVICWARLFPYTGFGAGALGASSNRGASATPTTTREMLSVATSPHSDEISLAETASLARLTRSQIARTAVTRSNAASTMLSYREYG